MRIKKHKNKNQYISTPSGKFIRNFTLDNLSEVDINTLIDQKDFHYLLSNEMENQKENYSRIDTEKFYTKNVLIVSDGYNFEQIHRICSKLPKDITIIAVNEALTKWSLANPNYESKRSIQFYVVNNPYQECMRFLPKTNHYPNCIASIRTKPEFLKKYKLKNRSIFQYYPTPSENFGNKLNNAIWTLDDYRNPVCAAIHLAHKFEAEKIILLGCDESFSEERPGSVKLENGLFCYPQLKTSHEIIDAMFYWMKANPENSIKIADASFGWKYKHAEYIEIDKIADFFKGT